MSPTRSIRGAINHVRSMGGKVVEAYPTILKKDRLPPVSVFMGLPSMFEKAGFRVVARPSQSKLIMRYEIR